MTDSEPRLTTRQQTDSSITHFWVAINELGYSAALWKLPKAGGIKLLVSTAKSMTYRRPDLEVLPPGFAISPFISKEDGAILFLEGSIILTFSVEGVLMHSSTQSVAGDTLLKSILSIVENKRETKPQTLNSLTQQDLFQEHAAMNGEGASFKKAVKEAVEAIRQKRFDKVVLSRTKELTYPSGFDTSDGFVRLCRAYPDAFVSMICLAEANEIWLGATPEILVEMNANGIFKTISLAGTQHAYSVQGDFLPLSEIRWSQKEIEEQALVSRYIVECFKKIRLREYIERGPKTSLAGNLYHLRTDFEVDTRQVNFPELGTVMLELLHPTSAVCGSPKQPALEFLTQHETSERSLYSGYLGPVNVDGSSNLFVNLRTMRLRKGVATVFAGAGITEDSDPEREWEETELKCQTLLRVLDRL